MKVFRNFVVAALAAYCAMASAGPVNVVKVINFTCPICRASEIQDQQIRETVEATGGRLVYAAMPAEEGTYARELYYYGMREKYPKLEQEVRTALYTGAQDMGLPMSDFAQVAVWLEQRLPDSKIDWPQMSSYVSTAEGPKASLGRVGAIVVGAGVSKLPAYVLISDGVIRDLVDIDTSGKGPSFPAMREAIQVRVAKLANPNQPPPKDSPHAD